MAVAVAQALVQEKMVVHLVIQPYVTHNAVKVHLALGRGKTTDHEGHQHAAKPVVPDKPTFGLPSKSSTVYVHFGT